MRGKLSASKAYIGINILIFSLMFFKEPSLSITTLIDFGAQNPFSLADGRLLNFIMPMFLHASWMHLGLNCMGIHIFGRMVEDYYGSLKFILISLAIGIFATLGSFLVKPKIAVGASGVVYGYLAFHIYLYLINRERYKSIFGTDVFILLGINIAYSFLGSNIDISGHLFGLLGGIFIYLLLDKNHVSSLRKLLIGLVILSILGLSSSRILAYRQSQDYYINKILYYQNKDKPIQRDELIIEYLEKYPNQ